MVTAEECKKVRKSEYGRESDYCVVLKKQGNACGGKAVTHYRPSKGKHILHAAIKEQAALTF